MKIKLLALVFCVFASQMALAALDSNLIKKRWKIVKYSKKSKVIPHKEDDFFQFDSYHSFEKVLEGVYVRGKWTFNPTTNILNITTPEMSIDWTVTELTAKSLKAVHNHEVLELEANPIKKCMGDPYDDLTIICGKWKVADHHAHYSRVAYKPGDYIQFFPDGTAEEVFQGVYKKMTWKYEDNKLVISDVTWDVQEIHQKKLNAERKSKNETIVLVKL